MKSKPDYATLNINGISYKGFIDMQVLKQTQIDLMKKYSSISMGNIFDLIQDGDLLTCTTLAIQAVIRANDNISSNQVSAELFDDSNRTNKDIVNVIQSIYDFISDLFKVSFPKKKSFALNSNLNTIKSQYDWDFDYMESIWSTNINYNISFWNITPLQYCIYAEGYFTSSKES